MSKFPWIIKRNAYSKEKILLAFEYGLAIANVAKEHNIEVTPELVKKAEAMIEGEFLNQSETHLAGNMVPNILSVFELDISK
jgi:NOL1/NOP2/fmu family ribosome biogenesis protein